MHNNTQWQAFMLLMWMEGWDYRRLNTESVEVVFLIADIETIPATATMIKRFGERYYEIPKVKKELKPLLKSLGDYLTTKLRLSHDTDWYSNVFYDHHHVQVRGVMCSKRCDDDLGDAFAATSVANSSSNIAFMNEWVSKWPVY
jgi:hypothetical protein